MFVSFNINSVRTRLHQVQAIKDKLNPVVIGLQETKAHDEVFPLSEIEKMGYKAEFFGQKTHYGVALLSTVEPIFVQKGFLGDDEAAQRRFIHARYRIGDREVDVLNGYFPQGENRDHPTKFPLKRKFYADLIAYIAQLLQKNPDANLVVMGDMNVAPSDRDVGIGEKNAKRWLAQGACSFLPEERAWYDDLLRLGLADSYRLLHPDGDALSWFDYRSRGFEDDPKRGLRIDHILLSANLQADLVAAGVDYDARALDKPSDHAPVWARLRW